MSRHTARERDAWREQISAYLDGELDIEDRQAVEREIRICLDCRTHLRLERQLRAKRESLPWVRPPPDLRARVSTEVEQRDRHWHLVGWPVPNPNAIVLAVTLLLIALFVPSLFQVIENTRPSRQAAPGTSPSASLPVMSAVLPTAAAVPSPPATVPPPQRSPTPPITRVSAQVTAIPTPLRRAVAPARPRGSGREPAPTGYHGPPAAPPVATSAATAGAVTTVATASATTIRQRPTPTVTQAPSPVPSRTVGAVHLMTVTGRVTEVQRARNVATVRNGATAVLVAFSADTVVVSHPDGRPLSYEQIGIADRVEVTAVAGNSPGTVMALQVKVLSPLVHTRASTEPTAPPPAATPPPRDGTKILYLQDGVERPQLDDWSYTRAWPAHLASVGYGVVTVDPARVAALTLDGVGLVVIGYPATLNPATLESIRASSVPVLSGNPLYVQALGLGRNPDPTNPLRHVPGNLVRAAGGLQLTQGFVGTHPVATVSIKRVPIVAQGTILATFLDDGRERAIWTLNGNRMYLGLWADADGRSLTPRYWVFLDRSVAHLLGAS